MNSRNRKQRREAIDAKHGDFYADLIASVQEVRSGNAARIHTPAEIIGRREAAQAIADNLKEAR